MRPSKLKRRVSERFTLKFISADVRPGQAAHGFPYGTHNVYNKPEDIIVKRERDGLLSLSIDLAPLFDDKRTNSICRVCVAYGNIVVTDCANAVSILIALSRVSARVASFFSRGNVR
jgi:hypothetical protein